MNSAKTTAREGTHKLNKNLLVIIEWGSFQVIKNLSFLINVGNLQKLFNLILRNPVATNFLVKKTL